MDRARAVPTGHPHVGGLLVALDVAGADRVGHPRAVGRDLRIGHLAQGQQIVERDGAFFRRAGLKGREVRRYQTARDDRGGNKAAEHIRIHGYSLGVGRKMAAHIFITILITADRDTHADLVEVPQQVGRVLIHAIGAGTFQFVLPVTPR